MSKTRPVTETIADDVGLAAAIQLPASAPANPEANGTAQASATPRKRPRKLSTPLQGMARIEQVMEPLTDRDRSMVYSWFVQAYGPQPATVEDLVREDR